MTNQTVHANCVIVGTLGLLIRGAAGSGKSALCECLIEACRARGNLGVLVADDRVVLTAGRDGVLARVPEAIGGKIEVRGFALEDLPHEPVARVHLVVDLKPMEVMERLPETAVAREELEGVSVPAIACPAHRPDVSLRLVRWALREIFPGVPDYI